MGSSPRLSIFYLWSWRKFWPWVLLACSLGIVRWTKGAGFLDAYAVLTRPFWSGSAQSEWLQDASQIEREIRLGLLERDNQRLRKMLSLQNSSKMERISAAVISRRHQGWWQQLELSKGAVNGIGMGDVVIGPGGLLGSIQSVTPTTSRVRLLTSPGSKVGVWIARTKRHGILLGMGTNRPNLTFFDKDSKALPGDVISTSPASTLMPPNIPVGVVQVVNNRALPAPNATVQLIASPEAIDWVQIQKL